MLLILPSPRVELRARHRCGTGVLPEAIEVESLVKIKRFTEGK